MALRTPAAGSNFMIHDRAAFCSGTGIEVFLGSKAGLLVGADTAVSGTVAPASNSRLTPPFGFNGISGRATVLTVNPLIVHCGVPNFPQLGRTLQGPTRRSVSTINRRNKINIVQQL